MRLCRSLACTERQEERLETSRPSRLAFGVKPVYAERWKGQGGRRDRCSGRQAIPTYPRGCVVSQPGERRYRVIAARQRGSGHGRYQGGQFLGGGQRAQVTAEADVGQVVAETQLHQLPAHELPGGEASTVGLAEAA